jgi:hypothetical protein
MDRERDAKCEADFHQSARTVRDKGPELFRQRAAAIAPRFWQSGTLPQCAVDAHITADESSALLNHETTRSTK